ncbi:hypothetical protein [Sediminibacterium ginsengisoli]|uniref:hypothetical protein n=1 Tax=Sediminibacterium ginsengisoli TaxID=413434 RepID=UPI001590D70C|nr:hypothetical protein [Sediminibacterium ginsengisoli]
MLLISLICFYPLLIYKFFWIPQQSNVLFWGQLVQWLSVSIQILYCSATGTTLAELMRNTIFPVSQFPFTITLSIISLYSFSAGLFLAVRKLKHPDLNTIAVQYSAKKSLFIYVAISVVIYLTQIVIWAFPSVVQLIYFFFYIKWGFFFLTFYLVHKTAKELRLILYLIICTEFVLGLSSFFASSFLYIMFFTFISIAVLQRKMINFRSAFLLLLGAGLIAHVSILWTSVKKNYRNYVTQGVVSQSVTVSKKDAIVNLIRSANDVRDSEYKDAIVTLVNRIGYVQYFAAATAYVPAVKPYEYGKIYWSAISHYLVPRFLDPDKETLDDSKHTNYYTGLNLSGADQATSFSLGTAADAYIDFGPVFMYIPLFLFGFFCGTAYKFLFRRSINQLWATIFTMPFFLLVNIYGADTKKAFGFILIYFVVILLTQKKIQNIVDPLLKQ